MEWEAGLKKVSFIIACLIVWSFILLVAASFYPVTLIFIAVCLYWLIPEVIRNKLGWLGKLFFIGIYFSLVLIAKNIIGDPISKVDNYDLEKCKGTSYECY